MHATSRASSKLLHGGLRYLGNFEFRLVKEALRERDAWLRRVPEIAHPLSIVIPIYSSSRTGRFTVGLGLFLYRLLAPRSPHSNYRWLTPQQMGNDVQQPQLQGGYEFFDGQSDDYELGLWVLKQAQAAGVTVRTQTAVTRITQDGQVSWLEKEGSTVLELDDQRGDQASPDSTGRAATHTQLFDRVVNVAGPWAEALCDDSGIELPYQLDLVRGSHLVLGRKCPQAYLLEVPTHDRYFFVLPWHGNTLVGTTEVRQSIDDPIECSDEEIEYLLHAYNTYMDPQASRADVLETFAGIRPLIKSARNPTRATREYVLHKSGKLITVLGGKWTTALALARRVVRRI